MTKRKSMRTKKSDKRRRSNNILSARLIEDLRNKDSRARASETFLRRRGTVGVHTVTMPEFDSDLLRTGRTVVDSSASAVALVGPNLGTERWRRPRCYLGLFWVNPRTGKQS